MESCVDIEEFKKRAHAEKEQRLWMVSPKMEYDLMGLCKRAGIPRFQNWTILLRALTHRSFSFAILHGFEDFHQRNLEFLGDRVLGHSLAKILVRHAEQHPERQLYMSAQEVLNYEVENYKLAQYARVLGLERFIRRELDSSNGEENGLQNVLADTFEALLGSVYVEHGLDHALALVERTIEAAYRASDTTHSGIESALSSDSGGRGKTHFDHLRIKESAKHQLIAELYAWGGGKSVPHNFVVYRLLAADQKVVHNPFFEVGAFANHLQIATGYGQNLKSAEHAAANHCLLGLGNTVASDTSNVGQGAFDAVNMLQVLCRIAQLPLPIFSSTGSQDEGWTIQIFMGDDTYTLSRENGGIPSGSMAKKAALQYAAASLIKQLRPKMLQNSDMAQARSYARDRFVHPNARNAVLLRNFTVDGDALSSVLSAAVPDSKLDAAPNSAEAEFGTQTSRGPTDGASDLRERILAEIEALGQKFDVETFWRDAVRCLGTRVEMIWIASRVVKLIGIGGPVGTLDTLTQEKWSHAVRAERAALCGIVPTDEAEDKLRSKAAVAALSLCVGLVEHHAGFRAACRFLDHVMMLQRPIEPANSTGPAATANSTGLAATANTVK
eukprot:CAMPEP_0185837218 /NCGR_PEP_ID=MMETSP1353-20130828/11014_1 /TAXON_ID=1077150 /ORGANISM="Erythrolobus australicus, Strain CCMP3124" /LENGTH=611 /DNA_ID=CAMNT_0028536109 /DNA_START=204 /DNA_END=2039 /DNA_ORIENTATION=-